MILEIIGIFLAIFIPLTGFLYNRKKKLNEIYEVVWKEASSLKPKEVLSERGSGALGFQDYYYERPEDQFIREKIADKENVLIVGPPLAGKTRAFYQAFRSLNKSYNVIIPKCKDIKDEIFFIPTPFTFWRKRLLFIDDLHRFVETQNFEHLLKAFLESNTIIVATCRSGIEYKNLIAKIYRGNIDPIAIFGKNVIEFHEVSEEIGQNIAANVGKSWLKIRFNGTVGSIFIPFSEMEKRFIQCNEIEKSILRAIRLLHISGIYGTNQTFSLKNIKIVCMKKYELEGRIFEWTGWLEELREKEFLKFEEDKVWVEEVYLENIIKQNNEVSDFAIFKEMQSIFVQVKDFDVLLTLGIRAYNIGIALKKTEYIEFATQSNFEKAMNSNPKLITGCSDQLDMMKQNPSLYSSFYWSYKAKVVALTINNDELWEKILSMEEKRIELIENQDYEAELMLEYKKIVNSYDNNLEMDSKNEYLWAEKGSDLAESGNYYEAFKCYDKALEINPKNNYIWIRKGSDLAESGKYDEAIECYDKALEIDPKNKYVWNRKGSVFTKYGKYDKAIECYDKALEIDPKNNYVWNRKESTLTKSGKCEKAIECYDKALEIDPKNNYVWNRKGFILAGLGKYDESIKCYNKAQEIDPKTDYAWGNKGFILAELGKYDEAIECYNKALEINLKNDFLWNYKGVALNKLHKYDEAIECYDKALEIDPKNNNILNRKGSILAELGKYDEAIECYDKALEINPKTDIVLRNKGSSLYKSGKIDEALKCYDKALEINPKNDLAWNIKGFALYKSGKIDEALKCYDKALEINPKNDFAWDNKGFALYKSGKIDEALKCYDKALEINPSNLGVLNVMEAEIFSRKYDDALYTYEKLPHDVTSPKERIISASLLCIALALNGKSCVILHPYWKKESRSHIYVIGVQLKWIGILMS